MNFALQPAQQKYTGSPWCSCTWGESVVTVIPQTGSIEVAGKAVSRMVGARRSARWARFAAANCRGCVRDGAAGGRDQNCIYSQYGDEATAWAARDLARRVTTARASGPDADERARHGLGDRASLRAPDRRELRRWLGNARSGGRGGTPRTRDAGDRGARQVDPQRERLARPRLRPLDQSLSRL